MDHLPNSVFIEIVNSESPFGIVLLGVLAFGITAFVVFLIRRGTRKIGQHLSDVTALQFSSALAQLGASLVGFSLFAHLIPELRALGTAMLAGASVVSVVVGLAAKDTLGNLIAGFSLVLYRQIRVGDTIRLASSLGTLTAKVETITLGFTILLDETKAEVVVPNNIMMSSIFVRVERSSVNG